MSPYFSNTIPNYIYVACLDEDLNVIHEEYLGGDGYYSVISIAATPDGGVVIAGSYTDINTQPLQEDGYLIKLDSAMFVGVPEHIGEKSAFSIKISPNPANEIITLTSSLPRYLLEIRNVTGELILQKQIQEISTDISVADFAPGMYLWRAISGNRTVSGKLIIH